MTNDHPVDTAHAENAQENVKVIIHQIILEATPAQNGAAIQPTAPLTPRGKHDVVDTPAYQVESPKNLADIENNTRRFVNFEQEVQIQELSDSCSGEFNSDNPPVVSEAESETETQREVNENTAAPPLAITQHGNLSIEMLSSPNSEQAEPLQSPQSPGTPPTPDADSKQRRAQKRQALEVHFLPQMLSPRFLDSILEENSDMSDARSDCSEQPLSRSGSQQDAAAVKRANAVFPKMQLDFSKRHKASKERERVRESAPAPLVLETKLVETQMAEETCTRLASMLSPESEEAELVYINSASSSLSDLLELEDNMESVEQTEFLDEQHQRPIDLDTDVHDIIKTTAAAVGIESTSSEPTRDGRESTPVNQSQPLQPQQPSVEELTALLNKTIESIHANIAQEHELLCSAALEAETAAANSANDETIKNTKEHQQQQQQQHVKVKTAQQQPASTGDDSFSLASAAAAIVNCEMDKVREIVNSSNGIQKNRSVVADTPPPLPPKPTTATLHSSQHQHSHQHHPNTQPTNPVLTKELLTTSLLTRQASNESQGSESTTHSQCTAINVADAAADQAERERDFDIVPTISDTRQNRGGESEKNDTEDEQEDLEQDPNSIKKLRLLCTETLASLPYGEAVLEELATVAQNIGESRALQSAKEADKMPYPMPDLPHINQLQLNLNKDEQRNGEKLRSPTPPPVPAPPHSYDQNNEAWLGVPTKSNPQLLVCLSPAQRSIINKIDQQKPDELLDAHQKFIERRGYHELSSSEVDAINRQKLAQEEQQILQTAAYMKQLRKSQSPTSPSSPPPPIPPPPVPERSKKQRQQTSADAGGADGGGELISSETRQITKEQQQTATALSFSNGEQPEKDNDSNNNNNREKNVESAGEGTAPHRLLEIISDTNIAKKPTNETTNQKQRLASSFENSTAKSTETVERCEEEKIVEQAKTAGEAKVVLVPIERPAATATTAVITQTATMQGMESELAKMFPTLGTADIFDTHRKRFSNIESSSGGMPQLNTAAHPKRHSHHIETHSYESKKRIENGQVVYDTQSSKHDVKDEGDGAQGIAALQYGTNGANGYESGSDATTANGEQRQQNGNEAHEIMSALKLNNTPSHQPNNYEQRRPTAAATQEEIINSECSSLKQDIKTSTYEEFRQRAKEAVDSNNTATSSATNKPAPPPQQQQSSSTYTLDHEKLFKDFDELKEQLHRELETGKKQRQQREKSASLYDLSRQQQSSHQQHFEELKKQRHQHMKELEQEIERSMKSRQIRQMSLPRTTAGSREYEIPIQREVEAKPREPKVPVQLENGHRNTTHDIPVQVERGYQASSGVDCVDNFRRSESMYDISDNGTLPTTRPHTTSSFYNIADDWSRYASDLGSSENIVRPFAREVEICYQRQNPQHRQGIRAPRLSASTNDLSYQTQTYDQHNAYNVRRTHAPMLNSTPKTNQRPHYGSCYSMIERNPNPTYISTTSRRGVSPAPQTPQPPPEQEMRQRRASLPREIHEQQLKYILSKEEELKMEFERLQNERRRLMEEMQQQQATAPQAVPITPPQRPPRLSAAAAPRLPTLSEDEAQRQQMAEEWLNKVAEREQRRLQKIIKISKLHENELAARQHAANFGHGGDFGHPDISEEFLNRVKERRHKLAMPADSDWESGAESQPQPHQSNGNASESDDLASVKILEGQREAKLKEMPAHLREFAKFSNHQTEQMPGGGQRELHEEEERRQEANDNSISSAMKKTSIVKTYKTSRQPVTPNSQTMPAVPARRSSHGVTTTVTVPGRIPYKSNGYQSEPEPPNYDSDYSTTYKYRTINPRRLQSVSSATNVRTGANFIEDKLYGTMPNPVKPGQNSYKNQPGRIEEYTPGHSSVSEKERKEHLDQTKLSPHYTEGNLSRALAKDSGYRSDSNLVFRKKEIPPTSALSPVEQKQAYKSLQAGGEPPLFGFRKPAPEKPKEFEYAPPIPPQPPIKGYVPYDMNGNHRAESPSRYYESDVNIHFKTPVRHEFKQSLSEEELAKRQSEQMQKLYQEERRRKYLQELQDMNARRHTDNFTPSQKSPIALNRYDDFPADLAPKSPSNYLTKTIARALYSFQGQSARELTFKKGDIIYLRRQIDKNWYEGEFNAMIGLLPANYVEIVSRDGGLAVRQPPKKPSEGQARAKYNFQAQSDVELSLNKGELVTLTRRVDDNWFEGKIANRKGIFPVSYVEVLTDIGAEDIAAKTTVITNYSTTDLRPSLDVLRTNINNEFNTLTQNGNQPPNGILKDTKRIHHKTDMLHVDTSTEPLAYRALYKYRPQNSDELELLEGDVVHVLEKCDDGWFVGTSQRTGCFGTFPGNYVERA